MITINNPTPEIGDTFGISVASNPNGDIIVSAHQDNTGATSAGSVYLFQGTPAIGDKVLNEDFEGTFDWVQYGSGIVTQTNVGANAVSADNVARKTTFVDPSGATKQFSGTVDDFEVLLYAKKVGINNGSNMRYSITQDGTGNGYGFQFYLTSIAIEKRGANFASTTLTNTPLSRDLGQWNTLHFTKAGDQLTFEVYKNQIVTPANLDSTTPTRTITATDNDPAFVQSITIDSSEVDTSTAGTYTVYYNEADASGNDAQLVTRTVNVITASRCYSGSR